jgi:hypothetical protein
MKKLFLSWDGSDKGKARVLAAPGSRAGVGEGEGEAKAEQVAVDEMEIDGTEVGERMQEVCLFLLFCDFRRSRVVFFGFCYEYAANTGLRVRKFFFNSMMEGRASSPSLFASVLSIPSLSSSLYVSLPQPLGSSSLLSSLPSGLLSLPSSLHL